MITPASQGFYTNSTAHLARALDLLRAGELVAFPTETVYGLGADARNPTAVAKIFAAKQRPHWHPLIVHLAHTSQLSDWALNIPTTAYHLAEQFWPGPLTLILQCAPQVSPSITGGQTTIGLRMPAHPTARELLHQFDSGIAAPSANRFGRISPTTAAHVRAEFSDEIALILDGGACEIGIESTIVDLSGVAPQLLRPGAISAEQLSAVLGQPLVPPQVDAPRVPGSLASHYAPRTNLKIVATHQLNNTIAELIKEGRRVAALSFCKLDSSHIQLIWRQAPTSVAAYAHELYANLRTLDELACDVILVETLPQQPEWAAIADRLSRAAGELSL